MWLLIFTEFVECIIKTTCGFFVRIYIDRSYLLVCPLKYGACCPTRRHYFSSIWYGDTSCAPSFNHGLWPKDDYVDAAMVARSSEHSRVEMR